MWSNMADAADWCFWCTMGSPPLFVNWSINVDKAPAEMRFWNSVWDIDMYWSDSPSFGGYNKFYLFLLVGSANFL